VDTFGPQHPSRVNLQYMGPCHQGSQSKIIKFLDEVKSILLVVSSISRNIIHWTFLVLVCHFWIICLSFLRKFRNWQTFQTCSHSASLVHLKLVTMTGLMWHGNKRADCRTFTSFKFMSSHNYITGGLPIFKYTCSHYDYEFKRGSNCLILQSLRRWKHLELSK